MKKWILKIPQKQINIGLELLVLTLGIIGCIGGLGYSLYFPSEFIVGLFLLILFAIILYFTMYKSYKSSLLCAVVAFIICFALSYISPQFESVIEQLKTVIQFDYFLRFDEIFKNVQLLGQALPVLFYLFMGIPIVYLVVSTMTQKSLTIIKLLMCLIIFLFPIFINHQLNNITSYCAIIFFVYELMFHVILKYQYYQQEFLKICFLAGLTFILFLSSIFLEGHPVFQQSSTSVLMQITSWFDDFSSSGNRTGLNPSISGGLPTGDITLSHTVALTVQTNKPFSSYLRGYSLAHYENNKWHPVLKSFDDSHSVTLYTDYLNENLSYATHRQVKITPKRSTSYQIVPYFTSTNKKLIADSYFKRTDEFFDVVSYSTEALESLKIYPQQQYTDYQKYVEDEYLNVPNDLKKKLNDFIDNSLASEGYLTRQDLISSLTPIDLAKQIQFMIQKQTTYSLKTGALPADKDFVENFLFETHKGSCTHYATTGALLMRCLGIPSRYVSGFVMKSSDFKDGKAEIRNNRAHAWIEIYCQGVGWIPFDMTPTNSDSTEIDGLAIMLDELTDNNQTSPIPSHPNTEQSNNPNPIDQPDSQKPTDNSDTDTKKNQQTFWYQGFMTYGDYVQRGIIFVGILLVYRIVSKKIFSLKLRHKSTNQKVILYYRRMKRILRFGGHIQEEIKMIAYKAKFSAHTISLEEVKIVESYYLSFVQGVYRELPLYKRFYYKFILGYI